MGNTKDKRNTKLEKDKEMEKQNINQSKEWIPGACSCMTLTSKTGRHYWFRTCDIDTDLWQEGAHIVQQAAGNRIEYSDGNKETSLYSFIGMTYNFSDTWLLDGINEHGLTGGLLMLYEGTGVDKPQEERKGYMGMELVTKMLAFCKNVEEVTALAAQIQVLNILLENQKVTATMHYFFTDKTGNEVILEATDENNPGILKVYGKKEIIGVMTNSPPYKEQLENLSWFISQSPELKQGLDGQAVRKLVLDGRAVEADSRAKHLSFNGTFPASYCSYDRFIRLSVLKALNDSGNFFEDEKMLALGSGIMNAVWEPKTKGVFHYTKMEKDGRIRGQKDSYTQYLSMYDIEERCFYMKKYDETAWKKYFQLDFP